MIIANAKKGQVPFFYTKPPQEPIAGDIETNDALKRLYGTCEYDYHGRSGVRVLNEGEIETLFHLIAADRFIYATIAPTRSIYRSGRMTWDIAVASREGKRRYAYDSVDPLSALRDIWMEVDSPSKLTGQDWRDWKIMSLVSHPERRDSAVLYD
jgi:hypothetical protein